MKLIIFLAVFAMLLSSSSGAEGVLDKVGDFEISPTQPNTFWRNDDSYDYNEYEIEITSEPMSVKIEWNAKQIGATPFTYKFTGTVYNGDYVVVRAVPYDPAMDVRVQVFRGFRPLPRKIRFDFSKP